MNKNMFKTLLASLALLACGSTMLAAEEPGYLKFEAVDALGNTDTLMIGGCEDLSVVNYTFPIPEAVNLYGVPPTKEIDVRILERNDTNYGRQFDATLDQPVRYVPYGLVPISSSKLGSNVIPNSAGPCGELCASGATSAEANIDGKVKYINCHQYDGGGNVIFKITAKHYPVSMSLIEGDNVSDFGLYFIYTAEIYSSTSEFIKFKSDQNAIWFTDWYYDSQLLITIDDESAGDYMFSLQAEIVVGIPEDKDIKPLYPNPADNFVVIDDANTTDNFMLLNTMGKVINNFTITSIPHSLDVEHLTPGTYYLYNKTNSQFYSFIKR